MVVRRRVNTIVDTNTFSLPALPEETKQYYKDSLEVLSDIRQGINQGSIIKMNRDVVGGTVSQSQSESGVNRGQFNR